MIGRNQMKRGLSRLSAALLISVMSGVVMAQSAARNVLQKVDVAAAGDQVTVRMSFSEPLKSVPAGFSVANPNRIVLDFPSTDNALQSQDLATARGYVKNLRVAQTDARMRVVLNLDRQATYQSRLDGNDLLLTLVSAEAAPMVKKEAAAPFQSTKSVAKLVGVRDVAFRRGVLGEGRVVIDLEDPSVGVDIKKQGNALIIEFSSASVPDSLLRKLDVTDFSTPVSSVSTTKSGADRVRVEVKQNPGANWDHLAYQTDTQFVLEVKPVVEDTSKLGGGVGRYSGERMSLRFREYPVREVLQAFSDFSNFNMVISDGVQGTITLNLQDVPWDQALDIILQQRNLAMDKQGNVVTIAPSAEIVARQKARSEAAPYEPERTIIIALDNIKAEDAKKKLEEYLNLDPKVKQGVKLMAEPSQGKLFIKAPESVIQDIEKIIKEIDRPVRQVMIEARIVEASDSFTKNLGARMGFTASGNLTTGDRTSIVNTAGGYSISPTGAGFLNTLLTNAAGTKTLNFELAAQILDGTSKEVSSPRVLAASGKKAKISDGEQIPYSTRGSDGAVTVAFKDAKLSLDVTPTINSDGRLTLAISLTKDSRGTTVSTGTGDAVSINSKTVDTEVVVDNGGTVVIGGIFVEGGTESESGVPLLRDIPVLGWLFKTKTNTKARRELLVFITPRLVNDQMAVN